VSSRDFFGTYSPTYIDSGIEEFAKLHKIYDVFGHPEKLAWFATPLPHGLTYDMRVQIYNWFGRWLKGDQRPVTEEPPTSPEPDQALRALVHGDKRRLRIENTAPRKADDVVQESQRTAQGAVLVVDFRVHVTAVRGGDQRRRRMVVRFSPAPQFNFRIDASRGLQCSAQGQHHEQPLVAVKPLLGEGPHYDAGFVDQKLRFHPMNPGRLLQSLNHVHQQPGLNFVRVRQASAIGDKEVSNHPFASLINEKRISHDSPALDGSVARQNFGVHVSQNHLG